ncbi:MAG: hypothetical protein K0R65_861 [Crocinitomicaceae bacterium]|jgi:hypothetical protein|nr:hypothetical protein [Crocinitomicaceae bacterium]
MKTSFISLLVLLSFNSIAQTEVTQLTPVSLIEERVHELDGGTFIVFGQSRVVIPIDLPKNTVEWYYVFTSFSNTDVVASRSNTIDLFSQISKLIDRTGTTSSVISGIFAPNGSAASNVYILGSEKDAYNFKMKTDYDLIPIYWNVYNDFCITAARQGKMRINANLGNRVYLGIKAGDSPVVVKIEVVAIVKEKTVDYSTWSDETITLLKNAMMESLASENIEKDVARQLTECTITKVKSEFAPDFFSDYPENKIGEILEGFYTKCYEDLSGQKLGQNYSKAETLGNMSWETYLTGNIDKAVELSLKALELNADLAYVKGNLGLYYLVQGKGDLAMDTYIDAITLFKNDKLQGKELFKAAHDDLKEAVKKYPNMTGYQAILAELGRGMEN